MIIKNVSTRPLNWKNIQMKNKECLVVLPTAILGGAERVMFNLVYYMLENNYKVTILIMSRGKQDGWESIESHPNLSLIINNYKSEKISIIPILMSLISLSRNHNYNYAFSSHTHINGLLSLTRKMRLFKTEFLISRESTFIFERFYGIKRQIFKLIYKFMYGKQDLIICQTIDMKSSLIKNLGFKPAKIIEAIPNPVNLKYIKNQLTTEKFSEPLFGNIIVGCGRLIPLKKFDLLIEAFATLVSSFPKAGLVIIGDGPERENLENLVKVLGIENKVVFTGKIGNPIKWFNRADIGVISSEIEGFPNVLIEMMASGTKQVITTPCTDGVNHIPYITVTESCSQGAIQKSLRDHLKNPVDNAINHRKYIEDNRSVKVFWEKVQEHLV